MSCLRVAIVGLALLAFAAASARADGKGVAAKQKQAQRLFSEGEYARALEVIDQALATAPGTLALLQLRAATLLEMRDFEAALTAYEAFLAAGPKGKIKRAAQRIVADLGAVRTTGLDLTITGATAEDPASVYLDTKSLGVFCVATPRCARGIPPDVYKLIVERPGHDKLTERVTIELDQKLVIERTMTELPSTLTIEGAGDATLLVDGQAVTATVTAGDHVLEALADGFATATIPFAARRGEPVTLQVALRPLVPLAVEVPGAEVLIDGAPVPREQGALVLPDGAVTVEVRAPGYRDAIVEVPATRPDGYRLEVALQLAPAPFTVDAPRGSVVTIDGRVVGTVPFTTPIEVEQGAHAIAVTAAGRAAYTTEVEIGSPDPVRLEVTRMPSTRRTGTWIAAGVTGAALVSWGVFGALAMSRQAAFDDRADDPGVTPMDLSSIARGGDRFALISDVSVGVGVAAAAVFVWRLLVEGKGESAGRFVGGRF